MSFALHPQCGFLRYYLLKLSCETAWKGKCVRHSAAGSSLECVGSYQNRATPPNMSHWACLRAEQYCEMNLVRVIFCHTLPCKQYPYQLSVDLTGAIKRCKCLSRNKYSYLIFFLVFAAVCSACPGVQLLYSCVCSVYSRSHASTCQFFTFSSSLVEHVKETSIDIKIVIHRSQVTIQMDCIYIAIF